MADINFDEHSYKNEKVETIEYVKTLIDDARTSGNEVAIPKLEKLLQMLNTKKYGLVWEEHPELVEEEMVRKIPIFEEEKNKKIYSNNNDEFNFLLEGDNLHSLNILKKTHGGKIDVIYIDPPYNTGNKDFKYNDKFVDSDDLFSHSKWLSFMERRLRIARDLLSPEGVIFVSIGDDENATLKLLMDEIFGEQNYLNQVSVKTKAGSGASGGGQDKRLKKNIEYLLIYTKMADFAPVMNTVYKKTEISELLESYRKRDVSWKYTSVIVDRGQKIYFDSTVDGDGNEIKIFKRNNVIFKSVNKLMNEEGLSEKEVYEKYYSDIFMTAMPQSSIRPRVIEKIGEDNLHKEDVYSIEYVPKTGRHRGQIYEQFYKGQRLRLFAWFSDVAQKENGEVFKKDIQGTLWDGINLNNLSKEGGLNFSNGKKPLELLTRILGMYPSKDYTVLDFFAGSGSTGHAVAEINNTDGGHRKYILCTNNENQICEMITYKRLTNIQAELPHNLKYFKTNFVEKNDFPDFSLEYELLKYITPLVELEFATDMSSQNVHVVLNENEFDSLISGEELTDGSTIFMHPDVFIDDKQNKKLKDLQIKVQEIPNYFFGTELWSK